MKLYIKEFTFQTSKPYYLASRIGIVSTNSNPPFQLIDSEVVESITMDYLNLTKLVDFL